MYFLPQWFQLSLIPNSLKTFFSSVWPFIDPHSNKHKIFIWMEQEEPPPESYFHRVLLLLKYQIYSVHFGHSLNGICRIFSLPSLTISHMCSDIMPMFKYCGVATKWIYKEKWFSLELVPDTNTVNMYLKEEALETQSRKTELKPGNWTHEAKSTQEDG